MKYKVSVIIPVYNVENYLDETINSVLNQDIGFEDNVELILVNDGSKDNSEEICLKYQKKYPNNVKYIYKDNSGVSDTRNLGYQNAHADYIMFLDADDKINNKSLRLTSKFLDKHREAGFVISRVKFFDALKIWHYMDFRFKSHKKIVDINSDIKYCQYHSTGILIRKETIKDTKFDKNVKFGEDMKFMAQLLFNNGKFGIEKNSILYYRKRKEGTSAVQTQFRDKSYYINTMRDSFKFILDNAEKRYGEIPLYFKHYIMNSISERLLQRKLAFDIKDVLTDKEFKEYTDLYLYMLDKFDDDLILFQSRLSLNHKYYLLKLMHDKKFRIKKDINYDTVSFNEKSFKIKNTDICKLISVKKDDADVVFNICVNDYIFDVKVLCNGKEAKLKKIKPNNAVATYLDVYFEKIYQEKFYELRCKLSEFKSLEVLANGKKTIFYTSGGIIKMNTYPCRCKKLGTKLLVFKKDKVVSVSRFIMIRKILYKIRNIIYIIERDGISYTINRVVGKIR